jgi:hypothetical protein
LLSGTTDPALPKLGNQILLFLYLVTIEPALEPLDPSWLKEPLNLPFCFKESENLPFLSEETVNLPFLL